MSLVLDSSILLKLVINEPGSEKARETVRDAISRGVSIYAADIALSECLSALWKHTKIPSINNIEFWAIFRNLLKIWNSINKIQTSEIADRALRTTLSRKISINESLHIESARKVNGELYTADVKFFEATQDIVKSILLEVK